MRDKLLKLTLKIFVYLFAFVSVTLAESFEFEAGNIETIIVIDIEKYFIYLLTSIVKTSAMPFCFSSN